MIRILLLCITQHHHGNSHTEFSSIWSSQVWSDGTWSNNPSSLHPFKEWRDQGQVYWVRVNNKADWSTNSKTPPTRHYPQASYWLPTSFAKNRASPSPIGHNSLRQERLFFFPHWSVLITRQLSVTQQRPIRLQYLWNFLELWKQKKNRRMMMNRWINQSDDLARKTNRK